jgi:hypothetical protein
MNRKFFALLLVALFQMVLLVAVLVKLENIDKAGEVTSVSYTCKDTYYRRGATVTSEGGVNLTFRNEYDAARYVEDWTAHDVRTSHPEHDNQKGHE